MNGFVLPLFQLAHCFLLLFFCFSIFDLLLRALVTISLPHALLFLLFTVWPMLHVWGGESDKDRLLSHSLKVTASLLVP